ncbi:MAG: wapA [Bacteroidetes bacterium]|jgi:antitoxin component YwqK of YwqJK toxin-antitoxin module|nr:wapA [Bacteroidota bacterium]
MKNFLRFIILMPVVVCAVSCQSDTDKANEVISLAMEMEKAQNASPSADSCQLYIQHSAYTGPVKKAPTQEELIKKHKIKTVKQIYTDGWSIATYDKKGNMVSEESDYSGKKTYTYEFDTNGKVTKEKMKYKDGTITTQIYKYDEEGRLISRSYTGSDGKTSVTSFGYNGALNTRIESSDLGIDKEFYDNRGLRVQFESYDEKGKLMGSGNAQYDENGLKISETATIMGLHTKDVIEYNEAGQLLKQHRTGLVDAYFIYEYNDKGLIISYKNIKGANEDETRYEYVFY